MALETNAFATYEAVGNREDLANAIYRIDPTDTPFVSGIERVGAAATKHEWQTQALAAAASNKQLEGDTFSAAAATPTVRLANECQISYKVARVTNTQRVVKKAGRGDEMTYQMMLKGLELRRDIEVNLVGTNQAKSTGTDTAARAHASVLSWIKTNTSKGGGSGADPSAADGTGTRTDGTQRAFIEPQLKTVLQSCWTNGGKPDIIMVGAFNKQQFSTFTGRASPIENTDTKKIVASVDAYESDFGKLKVVPNRFMRSRDCLVLQMDMWAKATLRDFNTQDIAVTGDSVSKAIITEYSLEARNEKASGGVFDLTTA
jgi:hypothetical protein